MNTRCIRKRIQGCGWYNSFRLLLLCVCAINACISYNQVYAQERTIPPVLLGMSVGSEWGGRSGSIPVFAGSPGCGVFTDGTYQARGVSAHVDLPQLFYNNIGLSLSEVRP